MKHRILSLVIIVSLALSLFVTVSPIHHAAAEPGTPYATVEGRRIEEIYAGGLLAYRGSGEIEITIAVESTVGSDFFDHRKIISANGECPGCGGKAPAIAFSIEGDVATGLLDLDQISFPTVGYKLTGYQEVTVYNLDGSFWYSYTWPYTIDLFLLHDRVIGVNQYSTNIMLIGVSQGGWANGNFGGTPLAGIPVTPESMEFQFEPRTNSTDEEGKAYFYITPKSGTFKSEPGQPLAPSITPGGDIEGTIAVNTPDAPVAHEKYSMPFAIIACLRGNVLKKDGWGAVTPAEMGTKLLPGDFIELGSPTKDDQGNDIVPLVCVDFYDGRRNVAQSKFAQEGTYINIEITPAGVGGTFEQSWKIDLMNLKQDVSDNHREYMETWIYNLYGSALAAPLKLGFLATKAAGKVISTTFEWISEKIGNAPGGYAPLSPWPFAERPGRSPGVWVPPSPNGPFSPSDTEYTVPYIHVAIMGDGSTQIDNWQTPVKVTAKDEDTGLQKAATLLGEGTSSSIDRDYSAFSPATLNPSIAVPGWMTLSPADGSHLSTRPLIQVTYPWNLDDPVIQDSLVVRLNGVLISPYLVRLVNSGGGGEWQVPDTWPLNPGDNELTGWIMTRGGSIYSAHSHFSVETTPHTPQFFKAYRGPTQTILRWQAGIEADLAGYRVYWASTSTGTPTLVATTPLTQTVYLTNQAGWYSVAAASLGGQISPLAGPVLGDLDPAAATPTPAVPAGFQVSAGEQAVQVAFTPDTLIPAYRLERSGAQAGPYHTLALLTGATYQDEAVSAGDTYWYRLFAIGVDGTPSAPTTPQSATLANQAPGAPAGFSAIWSGSEIQLVWDPSVESDLAGYNLYRSTLYNSFEKLNTVPLTGTIFTDEVEPDSIYVWKLTAVDSLGLESPGSTPVEISTWVHPLEAFKLYLFLPVVASQ
jgi:hypothetical protein